MAVIITVSNQKGGVGKTTLAAALMAGLTDAKKRVLGIDLDPQGNLGFCMGLESVDNTVLDLIQGRATVYQAIKRTEYGDVIPSDISLSSSGLEMIPPGKRQSALRDAIEPAVFFYDYIIIDTPPALNILTINAYTVSDFLIIPMAADILSLVGVSQLKETIDSVKKEYNPDLKILGIVLNKYNPRTLLSRDVEEMAVQLSAQMGTRVLDAKIRNSVALAEAPAHGESIFDYSPRSKATGDMKKLIKEISGEIGLKVV